MRIKYLLFLLLPLVGIVAYRTYRAMNLKYFSIKDFRGLSPFITVGAMEALDRLAELNAPRPVIISPASGSLVRFAGEVPGNQDHYTGRAFDIMLPAGPTLREAFYLAQEAGFNAIGVYPFWKPHKGLHVAIRHPLDRIFTWSDLGQPDPETGRVKHNYVAIERGFEYG